LIKLTAAALILAVPFGLIFCLFGIWLHPQIDTFESIVASDLTPLGWLIGVIAINLVYIIAHEGVHGIFFWITTHQFPRFGFGGSYAFAAAPDWFIPGKNYFWIGAAPLVVLSILGLILIPFINPNFVLLWIIGLLVNATGSAGDIYVLNVLLHSEGNLYVRDSGDIITIYRQDET